MADQDGEIRLSLRLPRELAARIRRLAAQHDRSLNGEIIHAVRVYADQQEHNGHATER